MAKLLCEQVQIANKWGFFFLVVYIVESNADLKVYS